MSVRLYYQAVFFKKIAIKNYWFWLQWLQAGCLLSKLANLECISNTPIQVPIQTSIMQLKLGLQPSKLAILCPPEHPETTHSSSMRPEWHFAAWNLGICKAGYNLYFLLCHSKPHWTQREISEGLVGETQIWQWDSFLSQLQLKGPFFDFLKYCAINWIACKEPAMV